jgi:hypothetical protein
MRPIKSILIILFVCDGCLDPFAPPASTNTLNALVVDGYIDSGGFASVTLSRTIPLDTDRDTPSERDATVTIESSKGQVFELEEGDSATYTASNLIVDLNSKYSLHIKTSGGDEYRSDEVTIEPTPPIDSIYFTISPARENIEINVDTHDNASTGTGYYLWDCIETYEYHAATFSGYKLINHEAVPRALDEQVSICWRTEPTPIIIASTHQLSSDLVKSQHITLLPKQSQKIQYRYSILVRQRVISSEEYDYRSQVQKSTEVQGSLFATIPGSVVSNVHSINNADEYVLGYFRGQDVREQRFFMNAEELPDDFLGWADTGPCEQDATCNIEQPVVGPSNCLLLSSLGAETIITSAVFDIFHNPLFYFYTTADCGDCRSKGGVTTKPDFW